MSVSDCDKELLKEGDLCLLDVDAYADYWPHVGRVKHILDPDNVSIEWFKGSMTTTFRPWRLPQKGKRKLSDEIWTENVDRENIWFYGFKLTPKGNLPKQIKELLNEYKERD